MSYLTSHTTLDTTTDVDEAAITLRFARTADADTAPIRVDRSAARRRQIRDTRRNVIALREAIEAGWEVGPELAHEERRLAKLEAASRRG